MKRNATSKPIFSQQQMKAALVVAPEGKTPDQDAWENNAISPYTVAIAKLQGNQAMTTLTVTARGQVTFRKDVLRHLGIQPGQKIELDLLPDGRGMLKAAQTTGTINSFIGLLAQRTKKIATIEEINEATARAWAGKA